MRAAQSAFSKKPMLFGHRGASLTLRENTMEAFARALEDGADALETDAHLSSDGRVVLCHDPDLKRVFGVDGDVATSTCAVLEALGVPTLEAVLDAFPDVPINIDIKQRHPPMERAIVELVTGRGDAPRVLLTSFYGDVVARVRALGYRGPTGLTRDELLRLLVLPTPALRLWPLAGARAQVPRAHGRIRFDTPRFIAKCHRLGVAVDYWVVNEVDEARTLLALGADGIMSDAPKAVLPAFARTSASA